MNLESKNIKDYLVSDEIIDWQNPIIIEKVMSLTIKAQNDITKAQILFEWVRDDIPHSSDIGSNLLTCSAHEVLKYGTGICFAKSHLLAALLRAIKIPTGFCYQVLRHDPPKNNQLVLHGLNGLYISSVDRWIRVDARGNTNGLNAQFGIDKEILAFSMDYTAGEYIYNTIYASPLSKVVDRLRKYDKKSDLWKDLPTVDCVDRQCLLT